MGSLIGIDCTLLILSLAVVAEFLYSVRRSAVPRVAAWAWLDPGYQRFQDVGLRVVGLVFKWVIS